MRKFKTSSEAALYLWDYFYISNYPSEGEERAWSRIECATIRIRESEQLLGPEYPAVVRVKNAKRVRRAAREIVRLIGKLETLPALWIADVLAYFEVLAESVLEALKEEAAERPLH